MMKKFCYLFVFIFSIQIHFAQENNALDGDVFGTEQFLESFQKNKERILQLEKDFLSRKQLKNITNDTIFIPIRAVIVRKEDGSGGVLEQDVLDAIKRANQDFSGSNLWFKLCGDIDYIDETWLYDFRRRHEDRLVEMNSVLNVINIYFVNSIDKEVSPSIGAYAYYPNSSKKIVVMTNGLTNGYSRTLSHELGHSFGLFHTHRYNNRITDELVDGSNCNSAGDTICDTPADPNLSDRVNTDCNFVLTMYDSNGDVFDPSTKNIMSYARKECRDEFSPQQLARMNAIYYLYLEELVCTTFKVDFGADVRKNCKGLLKVNFSDYSVGAIAWKWDINGDGLTDYTGRKFTHIYDEPGLYTVRLTVSNGIEELVKERKGYIKVGADEIIASKVYMTLQHAANNIPVNWKLTDYNGRVLYGGRIVNPGETIQKTLYIKPDQCYTFNVYDTKGSKSYNYSLVTDTGIALATNSVEQNTYFRTAGFPESKIILYPNPASTEINILLQDIPMPDSYEIYNSFGRIVLRKDNSTQQNTKIDVSKLIKGVYYVIFKRGNENFGAAFIKD